MGDLGIRNILYPLLVNGLANNGTIDESDIVYLNKDNLKKITREPSMRMGRSKTPQQSRRTITSLQAISIRENYQT